MTNNADRRRIMLSVTAAILAVAFLLSCVLAVFLYTRTDTDAYNGNSAAGEVAEDNALLNAQYG